MIEYLYIELLCIGKTSSRFKIIMVLLEGENLSDKKVSVEELLEKAYKPAKDAMVLHPFYG
jgi:hypothetical protein